MPAIDEQPALQFQNAKTDADRWSLRYRILPVFHRLHKIRPASSDVAPVISVITATASSSVPHSF
jgi:hypothetical protein